jgi:WD40 repeat protein
MQKIICEEEPTKPSTKLSTLGEALTDIAKWHNCSPDLMPKLIRGDLDWIVMKTLEKDRTRRYDTASTLGMDVQRHLNSEPVQAAAPSVSYRLRKLLRRHRIAAAAGLAIVTALLMAAVISAMYAVKAEEANKETTALLAGSYVNDAQSLCEQGHVGRGMLWLAHSLRIAPPGSDDLERAIRTSLAAWSRQTHELTTVVQYPASITAVAFTPDDSRILTALQNGTAQFCDAVTGKSLGTPLRHDPAIHRMAISPDGNRVATSSWDASVRLCDASTGDPVGSIKPPGTGANLAFTHDSARLITGGRAGVWLWNAVTGEPAGKGLEFENEGALVVASCHEGVRALLRVGRNTYQMFDVDRDEPAGPPVDLRRTAYALAISPDGRQFAAGGSGGTIRLWDAATGKQIHEPISHGGTTYTLAYSPDGSRIISGGASRMARLWDTATCEPIGAPMRQQGTVTSVAFNSDGTQVLTGNADGVVQQWDLTRGKYMGRTLDQQGSICGATFAHDRLWVLTQTEDAVQFRDAATGRLIGEPFSCPEAIRFKALSRDGSRLVTVDPNFRSLSLWDVVAGESLGEVFHPGSRQVVFSPDGSRMRRH